MKNCFAKFHQILQQFSLNFTLFRSCDPLASLPAENPARNGPFLPDFGLFSTESCFHGVLWPPCAIWFRENIFILLLQHIITSHIVVTCIQEIFQMVNLELKDPLPGNFPAVPYRRSGAERSRTQSPPGGGGWNSWLAKSWMKSYLKRWELHWKRRKITKSIDLYRKISDLFNRFRKFKQKL